MMHYYSLSALVLASLAAAAPNPPSTATTAEPPASCYYSVLPSYSAYTALMPNPNLNSNEIDQLFDDFSFACEAGEHFVAHLLQSSTMTPKPWFGAIEYPRAEENCTKSDFAFAVSQCMQYKNPNGNANVNCAQYKGETGTPYQAATSQYFASLQ